MSLFRIGQSQAESVRSTRLGTDVLAFTTIRNATLALKQQQLEQEGASDTQKLDAANARIKALEADLRSANDAEGFLMDEQKLAEDRAQAAEAQLNAASYRIQQLLDQIKQRGHVPDANIQFPSSWTDFDDWCDQNLVGRVVLAPQARRGVHNPAFNDAQLAARCLLWLANEYRDRRMEGGEGSLGITCLSRALGILPLAPTNSGFGGRANRHVHLTPGKLSAVRAAFKVRVKPSRIARQFGLSRSDVRQALASGASR